MSNVRSRTATQYSSGTTTTTSSVKGYSSTFRKSRILVFSLLYHAQNQILPFVSPLRTLILVLEMLQVISLCLEPAFTDFGNDHINSGLAYFARIRMPMPALASPSAHTAALVILIIYLSLVFIAGLKLAMMEEGTMPPPPLWLRIWGVCSLVLHNVLYLPALSILFSALHCGIVHVIGGDPRDSLSGLRNTFPTPSTTPKNETIIVGVFTSSSSDAVFNDVICEEGQSIAFIILACLFLIVTIFMFGLFAFAEYGYQQQRSNKFSFFAHTMTRLSFMLFLIKTIATIFIQFTGPVALFTRSGLYHWGLMISFALLAVYMFVYIPFYKRAANVTYMSFILLCFLAALMAFAASRASNHVGVFIAFIVLIVPVIAIALLLCFMRWRKYYAPARRDDFDEFQYPFEVEIITRAAIDAGLSHDKIFSIYWRGLQQFSNNYVVQVSFMQYLVEDKNNFQMLTSTMEKTKKNKSQMAADTKFLLYCLEKQRMSIALAMDGGVEEISKSLLNANRHAHRAKLLVKNFWESLLHEEDLMLMPNMVAKLEHEETAADRSFQKLRARFPQNVAVMRHYAQFLDEVKGDPDMALELYKLAEETEEIAAHHAHRSETPANDSLGPNSGRVIGEEIVVVEEARPRKTQYDRTKEKHASTSTSTPEFFEVNVSMSKPKLRLKKLFLDGTESERDGESPRKSPLYPSPRGLHDDPMASPAPIRKIHKADLARYRHYRDQAEVFRSHSVWKIGSAINLTLLILLLNMLILFIATMIVLNNQTSSINQLSAMVNTRQNVALSISSTLRALSDTQFGNNDFDSDVDTMRKALQYLANDTRSLYSKRDRYQPVQDGWVKKKYPIALWSVNRVNSTYSNPTGYSFTNVTTLDMLSEYTFWMSQAALFIERPDGTDTLWNSTSGRYALENGLTSVTDGVSYLVDVYEEKGRFTVGILQKITVSVLPFSFILIILLLWFLVRSAIREIQNERVSILKLFLTIPKDNILTIVSTFKEKKDDEDEDLFAANEDEVSNFDSTVDMMDGNQNLATTIWMAKNSRLSMLRNFFIKFVLSMFAGFALVLIASAIILAAVPDFNANIRSINIAGQRRALVGHLHSTCMTLAYYAETTRAFPGFNATKQMYVTPTTLRSLIAQDIEAIRETDSILKFGLDGASGIQDHPYLIDFEYDYPCTPVGNYTYTCTGLNSLMIYVLTLAQIIEALPYQGIGFGTSQVKTLSDISYAQLNDLLGGVTVYYIDVATKKVDELRTTMIVIFVVIFPVLLAVNFLLRPMVAKVKQEHKRTLRMLLMIPINVIDASPAIKDYLDSLSRRSTRRPWYQSMKSRATTKKVNKNDLHYGQDPLSQAFGKEADEALLVASSEGTIEFVSSSAERILGYERSQLLGNRITSIFDDKSSEIITGHFMDLRHSPEKPIRDSNPDLRVKPANGEYFPVSITVATVKMSSKTYFGIYLRNVAYIREVETQMQRERAIVSAEQTKIQDLLLNVFPKSIAEQLLIKGEGYQPQLIAEEYKEATVLFADIVGFTQMCSDLEPAALLLILDGIFTEWDALVEKHKLQKIKTIGDCFMAAGGVPDRTVDHAEKIIDFAMDMTAALHRYNDTCQILKSRSLALNIRIGINTGPVVAGIIGRSRMCFDLWGDSVNVASRMESTSMVGRIQVSQTTFNRVKNTYQFEERGTIEVKGKGSMLTYLLVAPRFIRTDSGKVIDNRFAPHLLTQSNKNGESISNNNNNNNNTLSTTTNFANVTAPNYTNNFIGNPHVSSTATIGSNTFRNSIMSPPIVINPPNNNNNHNNFSNSNSYNRNNRRSSISGTSNAPPPNFNPAARRSSLSPSPSMSPPLRSSSSSMSMDAGMFQSLSNYSIDENSAQ